MSSLELSPTKENELLRRQIGRERLARQEAERLLEEKSRALYLANKDLQEINKHLESEVERQLKELDTRERFLQDLTKLSEDLILSSDGQGILTYVSPFAIKKLGYQLEEVIGHHFSEFIPPALRKEVLKKYQQHYQNLDPVFHYEYPILSKEGKEIWLAHQVMLKVEEKEVVEVLAICRDITRRKQIEELLTSSNSRLETVLASLYTGILLADENGRTVMVNQAFREIFGISAPQSNGFINKDCNYYTNEIKQHFPNPEVFCQGVDRIVEERKKVLQEEIELIDGRILKRDYIPIFIDDLYSGYLWQYHDVTEQILARRILKRSEEKYRGIMENMELGLLEVDTQGNIIKPYPRFCKMVGYSAKELIGRNAREVFLPSEFEKTMDEQDENRMKGIPGVYEVQMRKKGGDRFWALISGAPFMDENGNIKGSIGIHYDITLQKKLQEELQEARIVAERAQEAEKEFLANMSHEIRNPINTIIGLTNIMFDTSPNKEQLELLKNIKYASDSLLALVSDILDVAKITEGKMELSAEVFDLEELLTVTTKTMEFRLSDRPVNINLVLGPGLPQYVEGDRPILTQIIQNLLGNSIKFTQEGEITLSAHCVSSKADTVVVGFSVSDTGIGISADRLDSIFERFSQAGKATRHRFGGTGLGLPITKKLVELHGGHIAVKSQPEKGTTFTFQIPFKKVSSDSSTPSKKKWEPILFKANKKYRVLIVEDNDLNQLYLERLLKRWQMTCVSCENGKIALEKLRSEQFDLILMDIRMPEMDGYETTIQLRNMIDNPNRDTPIIALTASALLDEKKKALQAGMNFHLSKPFTPEKLQRALSQFIQLEELRENPTAEQEPLFEAPFNLSDLEEMYGDDHHHMLVMFEIFLKNTPKDLLSIEQAFEDKDWSTLRSLAHKIKPTFHMIGLSEYSDLTQTIEEACRMEVPEPLDDELFEEFRKSLKRAIALAEKQITKLKAIT